MCILLANSFKFTKTSAVLESNAKSSSSISRYSLSPSFAVLLLPTCDFDGKSASTSTPATSSSSVASFPSNAEVA